MIDKITQSLTDKIRKEMPDIDDERAEVINYGLQIIIGEIPKIFIMLGIAYLLGVFKLSLIAFLKEFSLSFSYATNTISYLSCKLQIF